MKFQLTTTDPTTYDTDCIIVGIYEDRRFAPTTALLDKTSQHYINDVLKTSNFTGKLTQHLMLYRIPHIQAKSVLLIGCGVAANFNAAIYRKIVATSIKLVNEAGNKKVLCCLMELLAKNSYGAVRYAIEMTEQATYQFAIYKTTCTPPPHELKSVALAVTKADIAAAKRGLTDGLAIAAALTYAKDLDNQPGNICTPSYLAQQAQLLSKNYKNLKTHILDEQQLQKLKMGGILAVSQGSDQAAKLITVEYQGAAKKVAPIVLVGKGITFDSGGLSIKPAAAMDEMKYDMCGAAAILGVIKGAAELQLPLNLVAVIASSENLVSGKALKPGDIITTYSGQTVEVLNTDAEGRLVLCDALSYCQRYNPQIVIDVATLTGSIVLALGSQAAGLFSNDTALSQALLAAGETSDDRIWPMPLWEEYGEALESHFADMANIGATRYAGSIIAANFLARFTQTFRWAHLDIAGVAYKSGSEKAATGRPVTLLLQYLLDSLNSSI